MLEWGVIELDVFDRLSALLPAIGHLELVELSIDEQATLELEREITESMRTKKERK
ncbi:hypothetical protein M218_05370 [Burkholderia pseudomallei MSHR338]|nr:hypothetical protein M218_05370 [Burkholderia pseudomallei MSHR338]